ncbi:hypothetical protein B0D71_02930 [Pseudomonas laurylsulfativorans]|uniref:Uncharacterized protein n=1 Tax=Pseudomonas laurylsulfativorans TaxID=1943631 RepID=A0A2S3VV17_9PSED|nr:hypothetical protein B0D71_02930 [Pseudomonas laurylsulfativorans]
MNAAVHRFLFMAAGSLAHSRELHASALHYVLPHRREERIYPRAIRLKSPKYPIRNKNASQLN